MKKVEYSDATVLSFPQNALILKEEIFSNSLVAFFDKDILSESYAHPIFLYLFQRDGFFHNAFVYCYYLLHEPCRNFVLDLVSLRILSSSITDLKS